MFAHITLVCAHRKRFIVPSKPTLSLPHSLQVSGQLFSVKSFCHLFVNYVGALTPPLLLTRLCLTSLSLILCYLPSVRPPGWPHPLVTELPPLCQ